MAAGRLRRFWWRVSDPFLALWCHVVGHRYESVKRICRDPSSVDARELAALYGQAFGSSRYCRRCGKHEEAAPW